MSKVIKTLKTLIQIDSRNPFEIRQPDSINPSWQLAGNETAISDYLFNELQTSGFSVEKQLVHEYNGQKFYNILAEKGKGHRSLLFYAHMDTVSAVPWKDLTTALTPQTLQRNYGGQSIETLVALGSNDMKAGIAVILEAFRDFEPVGFKLKIAFGCDEEFYSLGSNVLAESAFMTDVEAVIVPEIGDGPNLPQGASTIGLGRLGRADFVIKVYGTGGHGAVSMRSDFINAASEAAKIVNRLEEIRNEYDDSFTFYRGAVADQQAINEIKGSFFVSRIDCGNGSLSVPAYGEVVVDFTFTPNKSLAEIRAMLNNLIDSMYEQNELKKVFIDGKFKKVTIENRPRPTPLSEAYLTPADHPFALLVRKCIDEKFGFINYNMGYSVADENVFKRVCPHIPVLVLGPVGDNSHKEDEWVGVQSVEDLVVLYKKIAEAF